MSENDFESDNFSFLLNKKRSIEDPYERIAKKSKFYLEQAQSLADKDCILFKDVWPNIAWACDVVVHLMEVKNY